MKGKLKITVTMDVDIYDLTSYRAETVEEAAKNQQAFFEAGPADIIEVIEDMYGTDAFSIKVEAVKDPSDLRIGIT